MKEPPAIQIQGLHRSFGRTDAVSGLDLTVERGRCYGLFGRNGAGKTTTIKCLLDLLRPASGTVSVFGLDPRREEVEVKSRLAYVPDEVGFHPWMRVCDVLAYGASFRERWNRGIQDELLEKYKLDPGQRAQSLSKGQKMQLALVAAVCPEPELLVLDEPTTGLDPIARREFMESVIGAYQGASPGERTVLVSTHLITEFEGLIDEFTIMASGRVLLAMDSDEARERFVKARVQFEIEAPEARIRGALHQRRAGRELEIITNGNRDAVLGEIRALNPLQIDEESLSLEEIFLAMGQVGEVAP